MSKRQPWLEIVGLLWWDACKYHNEPNGTCVPVLTLGFLSDRPSKCGGTVIYSEMSAAHHEPKEHVVVPVGMSPRIIKVGVVDKPPEFQQYDTWVLGDE
jgi:hypothetical protein